jgi:hypothetical protein
VPVRVSLRRHPDTPCDALTGIEAEMARTGPRRLQVRFVLLGKAWHVRWPRPAAPVRADELWRRTCLEIFLRAGDEQGYLEFNLTPAGAWAAYRFRRYREGMETAAEIGEPRLLGGETRRRSLDRNRRDGLQAIGIDTLDRFEPPFTTLAFELQLDKAASLPVHLPWHLGLSAVIEENDGRISYWALAHPPGKPDFHHPDCFALELPAARPGPSSRT